MRPVIVSFAAIAAMISLSAPAFAAEDNAIQFVSGTGQATAMAAPIMTAAPDVVAQPARLADDAPRSKDSAADMQKMAQKLGDPEMQDKMADMVDNLSQAMMKLPVGKIAASVEKAIPGGIKTKQRIRENDTLADLAGKDGRKLPGELRKGTRQAMTMMSGFAAAFATMLPEFEKMAEEMGESFDEAMKKADDSRK